MDVLVGDVVDDHVARRLLDVEFAFICTDSHASRAVVNQLAYQHLLPVIDMGVGIKASGGMVTHITGRVQMLAPGLACLTCTQTLDPNLIRQELLTPLQRQSDPYIQGHHEPQPAVISINSTVVSLAVTMFLSAVTAMPSHPRLLIYEGIRGTIRPTVKAPDEGCIVCSRRGALVQGDRQALMARPSGAAA